MIPFTSRLTLENPYSRIQLTALVILRMLIGWHFLYEGFVKIMNPYWTAAGFLVDAKWIFGPVFQWMVTQPIILRMVDLANMWGLVAIGLGLIAGCCTRLACVSGALLLLLYYVANPPFIGYTYTAPAEGSYIIVNKNLIELVTLIVLTLFPTGHLVGIDRLLWFTRPQLESSTPSETP